MQPIHQRQRSCCKGTHLKHIYIFVENWATAAKTKNKWCVCQSVCFFLSLPLSHFLSLRFAERNEFNGNLCCLLLKNCQLHTQFSFNYAICNLRLWPRHLIITSSHLLHSQPCWRWVWVRVWVRMRVLAPNRAWIFINFHNLCAWQGACPGASAVHLLLWPRVYLNINQKVAMAAQVNITHTPRIRKSCSI